MAIRTTEEATEAETEVEAEVEVDTRTRTIRVETTKEEEDKTKVTITTRDKTWPNQTCLNLNNQQGKLTNSKCNSSSQQHHKCR